jgi:hypothetical protein
MNSYGVYHVYHNKPPSYTPHELLSLQDVSDRSTFNRDATSTSTRPWWSSFGSSLSTAATATSDFFTPFLHPSTFRLMQWFYNGSNMKSIGELDRLVNDVILSPDFKVEDLQDFRAAREAERLDQWEDDPGSRFSAQDGWIETSVNISVPAEQIEHASEPDACQSKPGVSTKLIRRVVSPDRERWHVESSPCMITTHGQWTRPPP